MPLLRAFGFLLLAAIVVGVIIGTAYATVPVMTLAGISGILWVVYRVFTYKGP